MIEKLTAGGLTIERERERGKPYRDNNAFYQATRTRSLKEFIPAGQAGRPDLVHSVAINIIHEFIVVRRRAGPIDQQ